MLDYIHDKSDDRELPYLVPKLLIMEISILRLIEAKIIILEKG